MSFAPILSNHAIHLSYEMNWFIFEGSELRQKKSSKPWREAQKVVIRDSRIEWYKGVSKKFQWQNFRVIDVELIGEMQKR